MGLFCVGCKSIGGIGRITRKLLSWNSGATICDEEDCEDCSFAVMDCGEDYEIREIDNDNECDGMISDNAESLLDDEDRICEN